MPDTDPGLTARRDYGPRQMADYLGAFYGQVDRARLWCLQRAEAVEATPEFAARRARAAKATEKRRVWKALGGS